MATALKPIKLCLAAVLAVSCQTSTDLKTPGPGPQPASGMTARVVASDVSQPTGPGGRTVTVTGTATFTGLTVELWDGQQWLAVTNGSGTATLVIGNGAVQATLVPATVIPAGTYSQVRLTAQSATLDVTADGLGFSARTTDTQLSWTLEKAVDVTVNPDGSTTFSMQLQLIRTVALTVDPVTGLPVATLSGDFGTVSAPASMP